MDERAEERVRADAEAIAAARPTAANLRWGVERALAKLPNGAEAVRTRALAMLEEDERANRAAAGRAASLLRERCPARPLRILTHCNTGRLATAAWGTGLGAVRELAAAGDVEEILVDESRPLLQGARLTAWELAQEGTPHRLRVDTAGPAAIGPDDPVRFPGAVALLHELEVCGPLADQSPGPCDFLFLPISKSIAPLELGCCNDHWN